MVWIAFSEKPTDAGAPEMSLRDPVDPFQASFGFRGDIRHGAKVNDSCDGSHQRILATFLSIS